VCWDLKEIKLAICVPLSGDSIPVEFFESYISMRKPQNHIFLRAGGYQGVAHMRNQLIDGAIKYSCTHILFLDIDHRHNLDTIPKLLSHKKSIVSGLSYMRNEPYEPCLFRGMINAYETITEWNDGELIEVDSVGAACLLIDMDVFKDIQRPYFEFLSNPDKNVHFGLGEDVVLCNKLKQAGYKIFVDTSCTNSHIGRVEVNKEFSAIWNGEKNG
jgi:GT2 family glycosyltransferase